MLRESFREKFGHYPHQVDLVAVCNNPDSTRVVVGYSYLRNEANQISPESLQDVIDNAKEQLGYCPPNCAVAACQLRALANATPEELQAFFYQDQEK